MRRYFMLLLLLGHAVALVTPARADVWEECLIGRKNPSLSIPACAIVVGDRSATDGRRANAYVIRGGAYQQIGDLDHALRDFDAALDLRPDASYLWQARGEGLIAAKKYVRAIADIDRAIRLDPKPAFRYHARGVAYRELGDLQRALADFSTAISIDRTHDFRFGDRGTVYLMLGQYERALADFDEVTKLNPTFAAAHWRKSKAYLGLGRSPQALAEAETAIALDPHDTDAFLARAAARSRRGEVEAARADYLTALELRPGDAIASAALTAPSKDPMGCTSLGKRVALVVGNGAYPGAAALANPVNDADDVARTLREKLCFSVIEAKNATRDIFARNIADFAEAAVGADVALFYYAGHGMQFQQTNFLVPVDARMTNEYDAIHGNISAQDVITLLEPRAKVTLAFLDACRDNPIEEEFKRRYSVLGRGMEDSRGLAPMTTRSSETLVVFATRPNERAADGDGRNSPFTSAFLRHVVEPNRDIELVMRDVTASVDAATGGRQTPQRLTQLKHGLVLWPGRRRLD